MNKIIIIYGQLTLAGLCAFWPTDVQAMNTKSGSLSTKADKMAEIVLPDDLVLISSLDGGSVRFEKRLWEQSKTLSESYELLNDVYKNQPPFKLSTKQLEDARYLMELAAEGRDTKSYAKLLEKRVNDNSADQNQALFDIADFFDIANIPSAIARAIGGKKTDKYNNSSPTLRTLLAKELYFETGKTELAGNTYFTGVSIQDLIDHDRVPAIQDGYLDLSDRHITSLEGLENIPEVDGLRALFLMHNQITSLEGVQLPQSLQWLYLNDNQLEGLVGVRFPQSLRLLYLDDNQIKSLADVELPQSLTKLRVSNNPISQDQINKLKEDRPNMIFAF